MLSLHSKRYGTSHSKTMAMRWRTDGTNTYTITNTNTNTCTNTITKYLKTLTKTHRHNDPYVTRAPRSGCR